MLLWFLRKETTITLSLCVHMCAQGACRFQLRMETRAWSTPGKHSSAELHPKANFLNYKRKSAEM
jgi:hypothetical protein